MLTILDLNVDDMSRCSLLEIHPNVGDMFNVGRKPALRAPKRQNEMRKGRLTVVTDLKIQEYGFP